MKKSKNEDQKFHFENGLLKELRNNAAPINKSIVKEARKTAKKAAGKKAPKSILSQLPKAALKRLLAE